MYERRKLKDLRYGEQFVFPCNYEREFVRLDYDESDNTYLVSDRDTLSTMMWLSAEKEVFVQTYRW